MVSRSFAPGETEDDGPGPPPADPRKRFGRYQLVSELGHGGFGVVHRAWDPEVGRHVAVKILTRGDERARERFHREVRAMARLRHPNVVPVFDAGENAGRLFLVMDFVAGETLDALIAKEERLAPLEAARLLRDVARGVEAAHAEGILHRDLKPQNILVDAKKKPVVLDFGLARLLDDQGASLTKTGASLGTPHYMSPEQATGQTDRIGPPTDVYSLGATLYHALTGEPPFVASSQPELLGALLRRKPEPPSTRATGVPAALDAIVLRCLEKEPAARYSSMTELIEALDGFLEGARLRGAKEPAAGASRSVLPIVVGIALVAALGAGALFLARTSSPPPPAPSPPASAPRPPAPPQVPAPPPASAPDAPARWAPCADVPGPVYGVAAAAKKPGAVYAATYNHGVFSSSDSGRTWRAVNSGLKALGTMSVAVDLEDPARLYCGTLYMGGGFTWSETTGETWLPGKPLGTDVRSIAQAPLTPSRLFLATSGQGVLWSSDRGATFRRRTKGDDLLEPSVHQVALDPTRPDRVFATGDNVTWRSDNACITWKAVLKKSSKGIAVDPKRPERVLVGTHEGVFVSTDGGDTWRPTALTSGSVSAIVHHPRDPATIFAGELEPGQVYVSRDSGTTWASLGDRLPPVNALAADGETLYAGTTEGVFKIPAPP